MQTNNNIAMKIFRLIWFLPISLFIVSCLQNEICSSLKTAEDIINDNPDSTLSILREIDYDALKDNQLKALYGLLYTSATYKKHNVLKSDSLLDYSIQVFKDNGDFYHLADAYYYKGAMNYKRNHIEVCINNLKKAESLSVKEGFVFIVNKVYELLIYVNYVSDNKSLRMEYSKKFLESSVKLNDKTLIARASAMVASSYAAINMADSAYSYIKKGLNYIDNVDSVLKADILVYVGEMYYEKDKLDFSLKYAKESDSINSNPHAKMLLGKIEFQKGNIQKAELLWREALSTNDHRLKIRLYRMLSDYYATIGQYHDAYLITLKMDSLNDRTNEGSKTIQELQQKFDRAKSESALYQKLVYSFALAFIICLILILVLKHHKKKMRFYDEEVSNLSNENSSIKTEIKNYSEKIYVYENEIGLYVSKVANYEKEINSNIEKIKILKTFDRAKQKEIETLKNNISTLYKSILSELKKGNIIYETIKNKKTLVHYTDEDLNSLIDFYKIIKSDVFSRWLEQYYPLSIRQYIFLILEDLGYNDYDIADVLGVTDTTVRSTRSRIKKKIRP